MKSNRRDFLKLSGLAGIGLAGTGIATSTVTGKEKVRRGEWQEAIMKEVMEINDIERKWDSEEIEKIILEKIERNAKN